jgi:hypothetical protein
MFNRMTTNILQLSEINKYHTPSATCFAQAVRINRLLSILLNHSVFDFHCFEKSVFFILV